MDAIESEIEYIMLLTIYSVRAGRKACEVRVGKLAPVPAEGTTVHALMTNVAHLDAVELGRKLASRLRVPFKLASPHFYHS